jgi:hypothetical protein
MQPIAPTTARVQLTVTNAKSSSLPDAHRQVEDVTTSFGAKLEDWDVPGAALATDPPQAIVTASLSGPPSSVAAATEAIALLDDTI